MTDTDNDETKRATAVPPAVAGSALSPQDLRAITTDWQKTSRRKTKLIDRKIARTATAEELSELKRLKWLTEERGELFAPLNVQSE